MSSTTDNEQRFAYLLSPEFEIVNTAGKPLTGGWIEVYLHGTRNKYYCFSDFDGTLHPFQIPLDSLGSNIILASPLHAYDVYIYNKFGALVMSRYNIVPATNSSDAIADIIVIDSPDETINVVVDGGTNWHLEVNTDLIATASGLDAVSGELANKKDLQLPYAATGTVTKTITKIEQNENGEIEVTYQDIDLPPQVPNIDIISPSGTIDVTSSINPATNTKTFKIDIHKTKMDFFDGYHSRSRDEYRTGTESDYFGLYVDQWDEYKYQGDFIANSWQDENNINFVLNSGLYLITASIRYQMNTNYNQEEYIKISTGAFNGHENGTRYKDWSNEVDLGEGMSRSSIQVSFIRNVEDDDDYTYMNGNHYLYFMPKLPIGVRSAFIDHLQIVKLDSIAAFGGGSGPRYIPGYGIEILDDVIQVATGTVITNNYFNTVVSSINNEINEINTTIQNVTGDITELSETVTNIVGATGDFVNRDEFNAVTGDIVNINEAITNIIGATGDYATTEYVDNRIASAAGDVYEPGQYVSIDNHVINVTGLQPEGDYATNADLQTVSAAIPESEEVQFEELDLAQFAQASAVTVIQNQVNNVTGDINNINEAITNIIGATGDYATEEYVDEAIAAVTGQPLQQQQSDWTQTDNTKVDYIKHKPREVNLIPGDHIAIEQQDLDVIISATGIGDVYNAGQYISIQNGTISATGLQPAGNYATEQYVDEAVAAVTGQPFEQVNSDWLATSGKAEILNKPDVFQLIAGDNIDITPSGNDLVISASGDVDKAYVDQQIDVVTGMIPDISNLATNTDLQTVSGAVDSVSAAIPESEEVQFEEIDIDNYALASAIPDVTNINTAISDLIAATGDYLQQSDLNGYATEEYVDDAIEAATGMIPSDVVTEEELNSAIDTVTGMIPEAQVNADWNATSGVSEILNKPETEEVQFKEVDLSIYALASAVPDVTQLETDVANLAAATGDYLQSSDLNGYATNTDLQTVSGAVDAVSGAIPESEEVEFEELDLSIYALASAIPDTTQLETAVDNLIAATGDYAQTSDLSAYATNEDLQIVSGAIPSDVVTHVELNDAIDTVTGLIPEEQVNADWTATSGKAEILNKPQEEEVQFEEINLEDYALASAIPSLDGYATETYVDATVSAVSGALETDIQAVSGAIPESKEVQFKEVDLSQFALASAIPSLDGYATEAYVDAAITGATFEQVNADWTATSGVAEILNKPETLDITVGNVIAGDNISITASGDDIVISASGSQGATYNAGQYVAIANNTISVTGVQPAGNYATETDLQTVSGAIPESETVEFEEVDLSDYALASAVPQIELNSNDQVTAIDGHTLAGGGSSTYTAGVGITIDNDVLNVDTSVIAPVSAIPDTSTLATEAELTAVSGTLDAAVSGKQDVLTGITDVQVVNSLPASPVATVLYLIPEA